MEVQLTIKNISLDLDYVRSQFPAFKDPLSSKWSFFGTGLHPQGKGGPEGTTVQSSLGSVRWDDFFSLISKKNELIFSKISK